MIKRSQFEIFLTASLKAAGIAGEEILKIYHEKFDVEYKNDLSPLTIADSRSHEIIIKELIDFGIPIISEEGSLPDYEIRKEWNLFWLVDPLDGTKEFVSMNGEFTVNIALIENGNPIIGVIYAPVPDELYFASGTYGSYKITAFSKVQPNFNLQEIIAMSNKMPIELIKEKFNIVASRSHLNSGTLEYIAKIKEEKGEIAISSRGSSLKLCMIAEGSADIYPRFGTTMEWDIAAGHAIIRYSGGKVTDAETGTELTYNKKDLRNPYFIASLK